MKRKKSTTMIQIKENQIIIHLDHPCPEDAVKDLQRGIIEAIIYQFANPNEIPVSEEQREGNCLLMELLKATLEKSP